MIEDVRDQIFWVGSIQLVHSSRRLNDVAHKLARIGHDIEIAVSWYKSAHPHVLDVLHSDWLHIN